MESLLQYLNRHSSNYVLKGGTGLMFGYGLNRFSEDIDLDGTDYDTAKKIVDLFCKKNGFEYGIKKDTGFVQRFMIRYPDCVKPLKMEISFRSPAIPSNSTIMKDGIRIYNINFMAFSKANAYRDRDKLRDLFDLCFICNNFYAQLDESTKWNLADSFARKGFDHLDYLLSQQHDPLIDEDKLVESFLLTFHKLGLLEKGIDEIKQDNKQALDSLKKLIEENSNENTKENQEKDNILIREEPNPDSKPREIQQTKKDKQEYIQKPSFGHGLTAWLKRKAERNASRKQHNKNPSL